VPSPPERLTDESPQPPAGNSVAAAGVWICSLNTTASAVVRGVGSRWHPRCLVVAVMTDASSPAADGCLSFRAGADRRSAALHVPRLRLDRLEAVSLCQFSA